MTTYNVSEESKKLIERIYKKVINLEENYNEFHTEIKEQK